MFFKDTLRIFILCGAFVSQIQLSGCFGIQRLPDPSLPMVSKLEAIPRDVSPHDPPPRSSQEIPRFGIQRLPDTSFITGPKVETVPRVASPHGPPPRSSFPQQANVDVVRSNNVGPNEDGSYSFSYETSDGSKREEQGHFQGPSSSLVVRGSYSYTAPDGTLVEVKYIADEKGFRAESPHIPAIPPHSLAQIKAAEEDSTTPKPTTVDPNEFIKHKIAAPVRNIKN